MLGIQKDGGLTSCGLLRRAMYWLFMIRGIEVVSFKDLMSGQNCWD